MSDHLLTAIVEMREAEALQIADDLLESGVDPYEILDISSTAMSEIGKRFEDGHYFLVELLMAGEIMNQIAARVLPHMVSTDEKREGQVIVLGTVEGDVHDIGKNIVRFMLEANGYSVHDLGVDVAPVRFTEAVAESGATILGLSALLSNSYDAMKGTIDAFGNANLRNGLRIMVGGAPVDEKVMEYVGADALGRTAVDAVNLANQWTGSGEAEEDD